MNQTQRFFEVARGRIPDRAPFFPDLSTWYQASRLGLGVEQPYFPGQWIPDDSPLRALPFRPSVAEGAPLDPGLATGLGRMGYTDIYREFGWGLPAHIYDWYDEEYADGVEKIVRTEGRCRTVTFRTAKGDLARTYKLDAEGTWSEYGHMVKDLRDLETVRAIVLGTKRVPRPERVERFLRATEGFGICDLVVFRSPFGKLVHEYMGFENVVYALMDDEPAIVEFMAFQEEHDLRLIEMAASMPGPVVIISDHADENLISPPWYRRYCMPFYRKACDILHGAGKLVSTHLDGNFKGYLGFIRETGFDILDGCTPAPMFNYEVEELADATAVPSPDLPAGMAAAPMSCWCGVPAGLLTIGRPRSEIADFGERIVRAFAGRVILNVGDILPPMGDFGAVVALGERASSLDLR
ncbi:MAG: uroporphyrinogen decarboxylase family protein [Rectinemataceae bacterium]